MFGHPPESPEQICIPTDFIGKNMSIGEVKYSFNKCVSEAFVTKIISTSRVECLVDDDCEVGQCCANVTLVAGTNSGLGVATKKFCSGGYAYTPFSAKYTNASWIDSYISKVIVDSCKPREATHTDIIYLENPKKMIA